MTKIILMRKMGWGKLAKIGFSHFFSFFKEGCIVNRDRSYIHFYMSLLSGINMELVTLFNIILPEKICSFYFNATFGRKCQKRRFVSYRYKNPSLYPCG